MSFVHAGLVTLLRRAPHLIVEILVARGLLPRQRYQIRRCPTEAFVPRPGGPVSERRADVVLEIRPVGGLDDEDGRWGIIIEIQLGIDDDKYVSWSIFHAAFMPDLGRHIFLVPITLDPSVARWLRDDVTSMIENLRICVLEPDRFPIWRDFSPDEEPERALWMAMVATTEDDRRARLPAALRALGQIEGLDRVIYREMLASHFEEEMLMDALNQVPVTDEEFEEMLRRYQPTERERRSMMYTRAHRAGCEEGRLRGFEEGHHAGERRGQIDARARMVLTLLEQRGLPVPDRVRTRVLASDDPEQLDRWFVRAVHVDRADALLDE